METKDTMESWKDSYKGKLWSTAVQKCFEAPFVEVAIQHLLFAIDKGHQKEINLALQKRGEELRKKITQLQKPVDDSPYCGCDGECFAACPRTWNKTLKTILGLLLLESNK